MGTGLELGWMLIMWVESESGWRLKAQTGLDRSVKSDWGGVLRDGEVQVKGWG